MAFETINLAKNQLVGEVQQPDHLLWKSPGVIILSFHGVKKLFGQVLHGLEVIPKALEQAFAEEEESPGKSGGNHS